MGRARAASKRGPCHNRRIRAGRVAHERGLPAPATALCLVSHAWEDLRERERVPRIAGPANESGERQRWKIERSIAWLFDYRRLTVRYERKGCHFLAFLAFLGLVAALTRYKKCAKRATSDMS